MHAIGKSEAITTYPTRMENGEPWQLEYRYGMILVIPPDPIRTVVNKMRTKYDPRTQSYCEAPISLTIPLPKPINQSDWNEIESSVNHICSFDVQYSGPYSYPGIKGVVLKIEPVSEFEKMLSSLESAKPFEKAEARRYPFSPHMTIAEFVDLERTEEIKEELQSANLGGTFTCNQLSYVSICCWQAIFKAINFRDHFGYCRA